MYVQIEPAQFPERYQTVAARAAALMSKIAGIAADEHGSVEGFTDDDVEARLVSDLLRGIGSMRSGCSCTTGFLRHPSCFRTCRRG